MRSIFSVALAILALAVIGSSAWTIHEVRKNDATTRLEITRAFDTLNAKLDRLTPSTVSHEHSDVRLFMIQAHLARATHPIVVLGDSIAEAATFPESICDHPVVNAGIGGVGVDELLAVAPSLLQGKAPALVVVAIGTNDAHASEGQEERFSASYARLLRSLAGISPKLVVANIPPVAPGGPLTQAAHLDPGLIDRFNQVLPNLAGMAGASFIDIHQALTANGPPAMLDGVHLAPATYDLWDAAMLRASRRRLTAPRLPPVDRGARCPNCTVENSTDRFKLTHGARYQIRIRYIMEYKYVSRYQKLR
jgi:lysophospholipase L1-like esterase